MIKAIKRDDGTPDTKSRRKPERSGARFGEKRGSRSKRTLAEKLEKPRVWFEKTVEYAFALQQLNEYDMICPLAGKHERAGDAILGANSGWCVIEFKRDQPTGEERPASERVKFQGHPSDKARLDAYRAEMGNKLNFHHVVYGKENGKQLGLGACDYWKASSDRAVEDLLSNFVVSGDTFFEYVELLVRAKGGAKRKSGGKGATGGAGSGGDEGGDRGDDDDKDDVGPKGGGSGQPDPEADTPEFTYVLGVGAIREGRREIFFGPLIACYNIFVIPRADPDTLINSSDRDPNTGPNSGSNDATLVVSVQVGTKRRSDPIAEENQVVKRPGSA